MNKHQPPRTREVAVFKSNRSQAIRIPKELAFPEGVKRVTITRLDDGLWVKPSKLGNWEDYFARTEKPHEGFAEEMLAAINTPMPPDAPRASFDDDE